MRNKPPPPDTEPKAASLNEVLEESEKVKALVDECADDLSSVKCTLREESATPAPTAITVIEDLLDKSDALGSKVQGVADKLEAVNKALEVEVDARHRLEEKLAAVMHEGAITRHAAFHDALTGLPNRALFNNRLKQGLALAKRHGWKLSVMFIDLDNFKQVNDQHGHDVGDEVLKTVAKRLQEITREDDTVCRHGGDEFMFLINGITDESAVLQIAQKVARAIQTPSQLSIGELVIKSSIGIAIFQQHGDTAEDLIKNADTAMYEAKYNKLDFVVASR